MKIFILTCISWFSIQAYTFLFNPIDYRDAYIGSYTCIRIYKHLDNENRFVVQDTTNFILRVVKNKADSILDIETREGLFSVKLTGTHFIGLSIRCFGDFSGSNINFTYIPALGPQSYAYGGKK